MFRAFLHGFPQAVLDSYRHRRWVLHLVAALVTATLVLSGTDWAYFLATRAIRAYGLPAAIVGFFVPILLPVALYVYGELRHDRIVRVSAIAAAQAAAAGLLISSFYKIFTGRMQPEFYTFTSSVDTSREFLFGVYRHGAFWGWPSSHTAVAVSMAAALWFLFPRQRIIRALAVLYGLSIAFGVSISIHWLSDAVAAILIGIAIGHAVASRHRAEMVTSA